MTLWLILTIMTSAAAVLVSAPFVRRFDQRRVRAANDVEVYRDQWKEVECEAMLGVIDADQAESARVEIKLRLLAADRADGPALPGLAAEERKFAVIAVSGMVILGSVGLYAVTGNPDLPSSSGARRAPSAIPRELSILESFAEATQASTSENQRQRRPQTGLPPVDEMIQRLAARLLRNPKDAEGWRTLGWSYASTGRFSEASEAYAKAIELSPNIAEIRSARIDALVKSADGIVTTDAKRAIEEALKLDPKDTRARFFKGLAKEQEGNRTSALTDWVELLKDANTNEPWVQEDKRRVVSIERRPRY
jgi:cytochrome c-type biogenesis protein CcmH